MSHSWWKALYPFSLPSSPASFCLLLHQKVFAARSSLTATWLNLRVLVLILADLWETCSSLLHHLLMKHFLHLASETSYTLLVLLGPHCPVFFLGFLASFCSSTWCLDIELGQSSVLGPFIFSVDIYPLGDAIPCHCFRYDWHSNGSLCPPPWTTSLNFRLVYTMGCLTPLLGNLKLIICKINFYLFPWNPLLWQTPQSPFPAAPSFPLLRTMTTNKIPFPHTPYWAGQDEWFELPSKYILGPASVCHAYGYQPVWASSFSHSYNWWFSICCVCSISLVSTQWPVWSW